MSNYSAVVDLCMFRILKQERQNALFSNAQPITSAASYNEVPLNLGLHGMTQFRVAERI